MILIRPLFIIAGVFMFCGCSSRPGGAVPPDPDAPPSLGQLNELLHAAAEAKRRPPTHLSDLNVRKSMYPLAYEAVKNGDVVVLWGAAQTGEGEVEKGGGREVIAYEKNVPTTGGYVLLSGGAVKKMSPDEFNAAPKAGKPSH